MTLAVVEPVPEEDTQRMLGMLSQRLDSSRSVLTALDGYYDGTQPVRFLDPEVQAAVGRRLFNVVINWPQLVLDALEERLDVEGFRLGDQPTSDDLWTLWQANDLDCESQLCHLDALLYGRAFTIVGEGPDGPRITVESAHQVAVDYQPGTRKVRAALKRWQDTDRVKASLLLPDRTEVYEGPTTTNTQGAETLVSAAGFDLVDTVMHPKGVTGPPVVPFVNRRRTLGWHGHSELEPIVPLADAINKLATDMMVASEFHAMPRRYATGLEIPSGANKQALIAEVKSYWEQAAAGRVWLGGKDVNLGQFPEAQLGNFTDAIRMFATAVAAIAGLPPHYLGLNSDNPASADAIRSSEAALVRRALRKQRSFGESWEQTMSLALAFTGEKPEGVESMETVWRRAETPTVAQMADAVVKLTTGPNPIIDVQQAQEDVGYSPVQMQRMRKRREAEPPAVGPTPVVPPVPDSGFTSGM